MYLEQALAIQERSLGPEHQDTAINLVSLGEVLYEQKEYEIARTYFERALAIQEKVLGAEHPNVGYSLVCLGLVLDAQEDLDQARQLYDQALAIFEVRLGPDHRYTYIVRNNLLALDTNSRTTMPHKLRRIPRRQRLR
ncbi:MAG TPA: tetratricopeptide repeat protein [Sphingobacteriaceae bacterium]